MKETLSRQHENLQSDLNAKRVEVDGLKSSVAQLTSAQAGMSAELDATKVRQIWIMNNICIIFYYGNVREKNMIKKYSDHNSKSKSFIGYVNNAIIKFLIYYASHMHIVGQIVAINPEWSHVFLQDRGTYIHLTGMIFVSYLTDFSYFPLERNC